MSDIAWILGWGAMLFVLHLVIAAPAVALLWWLRRRANIPSGFAGRLIAALLAATLISPALLPGHFPLLLPLVLAYFGSLHLGATFPVGNILVALTIAAVVFMYWPMRSNTSLESRRSTSAAQLRR